MKSIRSSFFAGLFSIILIVVPILIFLKVWELGGWVSENLGLQISGLVWLDTLICVVLLLVAISILGAIFRVQIFRKVADIVLDKVPVLSTVIKLLPKKEELEMLTESGLKEVRVKTANGFYIRGLVTKSWYEDRADGQRIKWIRMYLGSAPFPFSGYNFEVNCLENQVEETGRGAEDYITTVMSFGIRFSEPEKIKEPAAK